MTKAPHNKDANIFVIWKTLSSNYDNLKTSVSVSPQSEYDQELPQLHTTDQPMVPRGRVKVG